MATDEPFRPNGGYGGRSRGWPGICLQLRLRVLLFINNILFEVLCSIWMIMDVYGIRILKVKVHASRLMNSWIVLGCFWHRRPQFLFRVAYQEATDFCVTLESKSDLENAICILVLSCQKGDWNLDSGGAGMSFYCSTQTGEDHRYVPQLSWFEVSIEQWKAPWLFGVYRGLYYPVI